LKLKKTPDGWLVHKVKRAFGRAKRAVKVIRNDGATLSRTSTYTNRIGRNTLWWESLKLKWEKRDEEYYKYRRLRWNTPLKDIRDKRNADQLNDIEQQKTKAKAEKEQEK